MPSIKPEPGMTYDFEVEKLFNIDGVTILAGSPSVDCEVFFPARAEIFVDGSHRQTITIHSQEAFRYLKPEMKKKAALKSMDVIDKEALEGRQISLRCTFIGNADGR